MSFITSPGVIVPPLTAGGVAYGTGSQALVTSAGTAGQVLTSAGAGVPVFAALAANVSSFSAGSTGLTPATATTGAVSLAGTLAVGNGGTSLTTLTANNVILGNGASAPTFVAPGTSGNLLTSNGSTWQSTTPAAAGGITLGTPVATTAGTQFNYTGIPSGKKQIEIMFAGVQLLSADDIIVQLGNSGGIQSTNYFGSYRNSGAGNSVGYTSGFLVASSLSAAYVWNGALVIWLQNSSSNIWAGHSVLGASNTTQTGNAAGVKTVSGVVDRIRITTTAGTTVFVAGEINISYS